MGGDSKIVKQEPKPAVRDSNMNIFGKKGKNLTKNGQPWFRLSVLKDSKFSPLAINGKPQFGFISQKGDLIIRDSDYQPNSVYNLVIEK